MRKTVAAVFAALLVLVALSACGQNDEETARANIKEGVLEDDDVSGGTPLTEEQAECFADGLVDEVGVDTLQDYGLLDDDLALVDDANPTNMSAEDARATAGVLTGCVDMVKLLREQIDDQSEVDLTDEQADCIAEAIDQDAIRDALAATFQGKDDDESALTDSMGPLMECFTGGATTQ